MPSDNTDTEKPNTSRAIPLEEKDAHKNDVENGNIFRNNEVEQEASPDDPADIPKKSFKFKLTVFMLCLTSVVVAMDSVIVAATLPAITVALKGESVEAFWVGTSYLLSQTVRF
jgi:hypothetical protein